MPRWFWPDLAGGGGGGGDGGGGGAAVLLVVVVLVLVLMMTWYIPSGRWWWWRWWRQRCWRWRRRRRRRRRGRRRRRRWRIWRRRGRRGGRRGFARPRPVSFGCVVWLSIGCVVWLSIGCGSVVACWSVLICIDLWFMSEERRQCAINLYWSERWLSAFFDVNFKYNNDRRKKIIPNILIWTLNIWNSLKPITSPNLI